jgi:GAF domain-containing protein
MIALAETLVALADTPVDGFDIIDILDMFTERCVELLGVTAAGLLLVDHRGTLNLVAASTEQARLLELFQLQNREGPCLDCYRSGQPVRCPDLAATPARWPQFAPAAAEAGFAAVHTLPMRLRDEVIGGLNLFNASPGTLDEDMVGLAQALADVATIGILHERTIRHHERVVEQLQTTLDSRVLVEQAKGVLAERLQITMADAFTLLRDHARTTNQRVVDLAAMVADGTADIAALTRTAAGSSGLTGLAYDAPD